MMKKFGLILDLGANSGSNIPYFLSIANKVIALEANPELCRKIKTKFHQFIDNQDLILINKCIAGSGNEGLMTFYIHKYDSVLSTLEKPLKHLSDYEIIFVESITYKEILENYGCPDCLKVDIEGYDKVILNDVVNTGKLPNYISFENCGIETLKKMLDLDYYQSFNIVSFYNFEKIYKANEKIYPVPLDQTILSPWLSKKDILNVYLRMPESWFDIHMTTEKKVTSDPDMNYYFNNISLQLALKRIIPHPVKSYLKKILGFKK